MIDLKEIFVAWKNSFSPTPEQAEIAEERMSVCNTCVYKEYVTLYKTYACGACGCPLNKKIFSPKGKEACPMKKWER